ncbi:MAG: Asp-tRNA(Asn)/Glu-tRNA(Gln) amidotransferase subunit GatC [Candidatus Andersenbacteria bacterium]
MAITPQQVEHVATLARIGLTPEQVKHYTEELRKILAFVEQLKEVDTTDVPETSHVTGLNNVTRPDATLPPLDRETFLDGAPAHQDGQLKVKGVFSA